MLPVLAVASAASAKTAPIPTPGSWTWVAGPPDECKLTIFRASHMTMLTLRVTRSRTGAHTHSRTNTPPPHTHTHTHTHAVGCSGFVSATGNTTSIDVRTSPCASSRAQPSARCCSHVFYDKLSELAFIWGGYGFGPDGKLDYLTDLWSFNATSAVWEEHASDRKHPGPAQLLTVLEATGGAH